jgi:hypothetical protein
MPQYLEIAVNVPQVSGAFHYHLPAELEDRIQPGHLVSVFSAQTVRRVLQHSTCRKSVLHARFGVVALDLF